MAERKQIKEQHSGASFYKEHRLNKSLYLFIPALVIVFLISIFSYYQVNNLIVANTSVIHTYKVINTIDAVLNYVIDIETHQRGYLVTGDEQFIADIDKKKNSLKENLNNLVSLTQDNPSQNERIIGFINLINQRIKILTEVMQIKKNNQLNTKEGLAVFYKGDDIANQVKDYSREIKAIELVLLNERNKNAVDSAYMSSSILIIGNAIALLVLILAFLLTNKALSKSLKEEHIRKNIEARLRSILESASDMIAAIDVDYQYIIFNEAYQNEFKRLFRKNITIGMSLYEAVADSPEHKDKLLETWKESLEGIEFTKNMEFEINNEKNVYEITSNLIKNEDNNIAGAIQIMRNVTKRIQEQVELKEAYEKLHIGMKELQDKNSQITLLVEMSDIMLACNSQEELGNVITKYCQRILNFAKGHLYVMHPSKNYLELITNWGNPTAQETTFPPDKCWSIRLGRAHHVNLSQNGLICDHLQLSDKKGDVSCLCAPLMAQNDIYGLLSIEMMEGVVLSDNQRLLINAFSELTALALANVRLSENLRYQSIRDPLTSLYNRRYLEDFLYKQIHQAERTGMSLAVLMLDLDHFKKINDTYGHDAGDAVLKELGKILQNDIRVGDTAARYGGEEFIIVFYNSDIEMVKKRAENIRHSISMLQVKYGAQEVGPITISIGISAYPMHGNTPAELIESADRALYLAKKNGRNQVVLYSDS